VAEFGEGGFVGGWCGGILKRDCWLVRVWGMWGGECDLGRACWSGEIAENWRFWGVGGEVDQMFVKLGV